MVYNNLTPRAEMKQARHLPMPVRPALAGIALCLLLFAPAARAFDFAVSSETLGEAYRIRGRDGLFVIPKIRVAENLSLFGSHTFAASPQKKALPVRLTLNVKLSFDHDFGVKDEELEPRSPSTFIPLLRRTSFGLLRGTLQLAVGKAKRGTITLGRQTCFDVTGAYAFDGVRAGVFLPGIAAADLAFGFETIPFANFAVADYSAEGISWGDRDGLEAGVHPEIAAPGLRPMVAAAARLLVSPAGTLSVGYRRTWSGLSMDEVSLERVSLGFDLSPAGGRLQADAVASWDLVWMRLCELSARTRLQLLPRWGLDLGLLRYYPVFDASSIFNVFDFSPFTELSAGLSFEPGGRLRLSAGGLVRRTETSGEGDGAAALTDGGGQLALSFVEGRFALTAAARLTGGESGTLAGLEVTPSVRLFNDALALRAGGGIWFTDDPLRRGHHAVTGGASLGLSWDIYRGIRLTGTGNLYKNRVNGLGLSTLWVLAVAI